MIILLRKLGLLGVVTAIVVNLVAGVVGTAVAGKTKRNYVLIRTNLIKIYFFISELLHDFKQPLFDNIYRYIYT